jgi:hypothetical protein
VDDYGNGRRVPAPPFDSIDTSGSRWRWISSRDTKQFTHGQTVGPPDCPQRPSRRVKIFPDGGIALHSPVRGCRTHARSLERWLPATWWSVLLRFFLPASRKYLRLVDAFKRKNFGAYTIALQRRRAYGKQGQNDAALFAPLSDDFTFFEAMEQLSIQAPVPYCDVTW